jgi:hypothetical protein
MDDWEVQVEKLWLTVIRLDNVMRGLEVLVESVEWLAIGKVV